MARSLADFVGAALESVEEISPERALEVLTQPDRDGWHFIDVREPDEYAEGHIAGARNYRGAECGERCALLPRTPPLAASA